MNKLSSKNYYLYTYVLSVVLFTLSLSSNADTKKETSVNFLVTADTLKKSKQLNNTLFIDVRNKQFFSEKHIPGSLNIPLQLISTKAFLKNKKVVLVGSGWNESSLIQKSMQLKTKGFISIKVLTGGIISWFKMIKGVRFEFNNNKSSLTPFIKLTSKEFFNVDFEKKFVPVVILNTNVTAKAKKQINETLPHARIMSQKQTSKQLLSNIKRIGKGNNPIVIFSNTTPVIDTVINDYLRKPLRKIYFFEGGFDTYKKVNNLNKMTALSNQKKRLSTKKPVSCAN